jgi:hypothetical protein
MGQGTTLLVGLKDWATKGSINAELVFTNANKVSCNRCHLLYEKSVLPKPRATRSDCYSFLGRRECHELINQEMC